MGALRNASTASRTGRGGFYMPRTVRRIPRHGLIA